MKKLFLKLTAAGLIGAMAFSMVGCSSDEGSSKKKSHKKDRDRREEVEETTAAPADDYSDCTTAAPAYDYWTDTTEAVNIAIDFEVSDFVHIEEREINLSNSRDITLVEQVPQVTLADITTQDEINQLLCDQLVSLKVSCLPNNLVVFNITNCYTLVGMDGGEPVTQYVINLETGKRLSNSELLNMAGFGGMSMHDVCFNAISTYDLGYYYDYYSDPSWPSADNQNFFQIDANGNLFFEVWFSEGDSSTTISLSGAEYKPVESVWSFRYNFIQDPNSYAYEYSGISSVEYDPL